MFISTITKKIADFIWLLFLSLSISVSIYSQELTKTELDSLYIKFLQVRAPEFLTEAERSTNISYEDRKCGFNITSEVKINFNQFTFEQRQFLKQILSRPSNMQKSIVSPSGFFRVHFDTTNSNGNGIPSYVPGWSVDQNVAEVAKALDSAYNFEVNFIGFLPPPQDDIAGSDYRYDIYIINQSSQVYGYTEWESKVGPVNWTSFMVIDNNYSGYYSIGLNGMKVTVAHEFHHGIQIGNYAVENSNSPFRDSDVFFYELTSTSMEEFVYDDVNDYYAYMDSYFRRTYNSFPNQNGYNLAIWNIYLMENFGFESFKFLLKRQWELIPGREALLAVNQSLLEESTSFPKELNGFGIWTFFTGFRSIPGKYFEEAINYPLITPTFTIQYPTAPPDMRAQPTSNNFVLFNIPSNGDSLFAIITNGDAFAASENPNQLFDFDYVLFADTISGKRKLGDNYSSDFSVSNPTFWSVAEVLNNQLIKADSLIIPSSGDVSYAYPNPFSYNKSYITGSLIFLPFNAYLADVVDFNVYSVGMQIVFSNQLNIQNLPGDQRGVSWDGLDNNRKKLASGVYIYVIKKGDDVVKGKVVIFNE